MQVTNTYFIGKVLNHIEELSSTNQYALELLSKSRPTEGTVISTYNQTAGRGQIGSTWESAPGKNLTLSILLYPNFLPAFQNFLLNKAFSLGVRDFVASYLPNIPVYVKWPNDIYIDSRKVGGLLIQNTLQQQTIHASVLGIGLNINQSTFNAAPNATSLFLETGNIFPLDTLLNTLCYFVENRYLQLKQHKHVELDADYLTHLYRIGKETEFEQPTGTRFRGQIIGVAPTGHLQVMRDTVVQQYDLKEIKVVFP